MGQTAQATARGGRGTSRRARRPRAAPRAREARRAAAAAARASHAPARARARSPEIRGDPRRSAGIRGDPRRRRRRRTRAFSTARARRRVGASVVGARWTLACKRAARRRAKERVASGGGNCATGAGTARKEKGRKPRCARGVGSWQGAWCREVLAGERAGCCPAPRGGGVRRVCGRWGRGVAAWKEKRKKPRPHAVAASRKARRDGYASSSAHGGSSAASVPAGHK